MDIILQYMLNQVSIKDFATLSNPAECKKYMVFMANNLFQYFHKIRVLPVMDVRGFLAFRKLDDLQKDQDKMSKEQEAQKQTLCLSLSYFYTRIFQIYGALALTLIDDVQYMSSTGAIKLGATDSLVTPGESQQIVRPRSRMGGGGPGSKILGNFYFLDPILDTALLNLGYTVAHRTHKTSKDEMFFRLVDKKDEKNTDDDIQEGRFAITYPGIPRAARYYITARRVPSSSEIILTFGELKYTDTNMQDLTDIPDEKVVTDKEILIEPNKAKPSEFVMRKPPYRTRDGEPMKAVNYMTARLEKVLEHLKKRVGTVKAPSTTTTSTSVSDTIDDIGVDEQLKWTRLRSNLTKDRPPGHCVARALQLLRTPVLSSAEGVSHICKIDFYEKPLKSDRGGLPSPDGFLTAPSDLGDKKPGSAGLAAFYQLFYDVVGTGSKLMIGIKKGPAGQPSSFEQYTRFMRTMSILFEDNESAPGKIRTDAELQKVGLNGLRNKRDEEKCKGKSPGSIPVPPASIPVSAGVAQEVQKVVRRLFKIQFDHANECGRIMAMLFDIKYDKEKNPIEIGFSTKLLKEGFPELERINHFAREVLLKYYARCEGSYKEGMDMVLEDHKKRVSAQTAAKAAANLGLQPQEIQAAQAKQASRNAKGQLLAPGATHTAVQAPPLIRAPSAPVQAVPLQTGPTNPPPAPILQMAESAPTTAKTGPPLLQLKPTLTAPDPAAPTLSRKERQTQRAKYANALKQVTPGNWHAGPPPNGGTRKRHPTRQ
jgi:hypothetical protein